MTHTLRSTAVCLAISSFVTTASAVSINFDTNADGSPLSAPAIFDSASPLRNTYSSLGVHFAGPTAPDGGAILNDSTFTSHALSGSNFLAFSAVAGEYIGPETISFDSLMSNVSIYACCLSHSMTATMTAYNTGGTAVGTQTILLSGGGYSQLSITSAGDIKSVVLSVPDAGLNSFVFDNLSTSATVPEPSICGMLSGTLLMLRKRNCPTRGAR